MLKVLWRMFLCPLHVHLWSVWSRPEEFGFIAAQYRDCLICDKRQHSWIPRYL